MGRSLVASLAILGLLALVSPPPEKDSTTATPVVSTFSICAFDPETGAVGVAVTSRVPHVGRVVPFVEAEVGAVATQATARVAYGPEILAALREGKSAEEALREAVARDERSSVRQLGVIDAKGRPAAFTGSECLPYAGHRTGKHYTVQGNLLVGPQVIDAVAEEFERTEGTGMPLAERLLRALLAGQRAGGDKRTGNLQSAALVVDIPDRNFWTGSGPTIDLRVAEHPQPVLELRRQYETIRRELGYREFHLIQGRDVRQLQRMLHRLGYWKPDLPLDKAISAPSAGIYDKETADAVDRYRRDHQLPTPEDRLGHAPGIVDRAFVEKLKGCFYGYANCKRCTEKTTPQPAD